MIDGCVIHYIRGLSDDIGYKVGTDGVTLIEYTQYSPEPYCVRVQYNVYKGDKLYSVVNNEAIAEVIYSYKESAD